MDLIIDGFMRRFRQEYDLDGLTEDQLFETFAAFCTIRKYYEGDLKPDDCRTGGKGDRGVDAAAVIINGRLFTDPQELKDSIASQNLIDPRFVIVQARTGAPFSGDTFAMLASNLRLVFNQRPLQGTTTPELDRFRQCIDAVYADKTKLRPGSPLLSIFYVAPGNPNQAALSTKRKQAIDDLKATGWFADVELEAVGAEEIRALYHRAHDPLKASMKVTAFMPLPDMASIDQAHLGVVSVRELVDRVLTDDRGHIRHSLFYDNVRGFLQLANPVNQEIHKSIEDKARQNRFAIMNNGITIVTRDLRITGHQFDLSDFHIVNGCQTCHVLVYDRKQLDLDTNITVRIIVTRNDEAIADVVQATNRQTAIAATSWDSRLPFQKQLEDYFAAQLPPRQLLYERRLGQFGVGRIGSHALPLSANSSSAHAGLPRARIMQPGRVARAFISAFKAEAWRASAAGALPERTIFGSTSDPMPFFTASSVLFRVEYLMANRKVDAMLRPARYHMVAAAKSYVVGLESLPASGPRRVEWCNKILDIVWDPDEAEKLFTIVVKVLRRARDTAQPHGDAYFASQLIRSKVFSDHVVRIAAEMGAKD